MKKYSFELTPAFIGRKLCAFNLKIMRKGFFRTKVMYSGAIFVKPNMETSLCGNSSIPYEAIEQFDMAETEARQQASFIFESHKTKTRTGLL